MKVVMEESKGDVTIKNGEKVGGLDSREISKGLAFLTMPLRNLVVVSDFRQERKAYTYIRVHRRVFYCNPIESEVKRWLKSQFRSRTCGHFLCVLAVKLKWTKIVVKLLETRGVKTQWY